MTFHEFRPDLFALALLAAFRCELLPAQDPHKAFDEFAVSVYEEWDDVS